MAASIAVKNLLAMSSVARCSAPYHPLGLTALSGLKILALHAGVDLLLYGIQTALFIAAMTMLARRSPRSRLITAVIIGLFLASSLSVAVELEIYSKQFQVVYGCVASQALLIDLNFVQTGAQRLNFLLSDSVVVWRAWTLWPDSRAAKVVLILCMCGSMAGVAAELFFVWHDG